MLLTKSAKCHTFENVIQYLGLPCEAGPILSGLLHLLLPPVVRTKAYIGAVALLEKSMWHKHKILAHSMCIGLASSDGHVSLKMANSVQVSEDLPGEKQAETKPTKPVNH